eukprot:364088-Chlamydomonas_euryale.AAC.2
MCPHRVPHASDPMCTLPPITLPSQVIKVGTSSLVDPARGQFELAALARICETVKSLRDAGALGLREGRRS